MNTVSELAAKEHNDEDAIRVKPTGGVAARPPSDSDDVATPQSHGPPRKSHPPPPPSMRHHDATKDLRKLDVKGVILARDVMTRQLFTIGEDDTLEHLQEQMQAFRFRHLPVVEGDRLIGLITHADLLGASSSFLSDKAKERDELIHRLPAKAIMQRAPRSVRPTTTLAEVAILMWEGRVGCVPVIEDDGTLVGIITDADFIRVAYHFLIPPQVEHAFAAALPGPLVDVRPASPAG